MGWNVVCSVLFKESVRSRVSGSLKDVSLTWWCNKNPGEKTKANKESPANKWEVNTEGGGRKKILERGKGLKEKQNVARSQ